MIGTTVPRRGAPGTGEREPFDLRLAIGTGAAWLATVACLARPQAVSLALGIGCALLAVGVLAACAGQHARTFARMAPGVALAAACAALVLLPLAARIGHARASPLVQQAWRHAAVTLTLTVDSDPVTLAAHGTGGVARAEIRGTASTLSVGGIATPTDGDVVILGDARSWRDVLPGQRVAVEGTLQPPLDPAALSVALFSHRPPHLLGRPPWWQRAAGGVRAALRRAVAGLPGEERGLLPGLVDGDTANLDPVLAEHFRLAGLTHLVAVSGTNCSLLIGTVVLALRRLRVRPWICAAAGVAVLALFVAVARPSPSVLRAALMAVVALGALAAGRPRAAVPALSAVTLALLVWDPQLAATASFAMSVLATGALLLVAPGWAQALRRRHVPPGVAESVAVAAAAHLVTAPVIAGISGQVSVVAVPANVLAEPVVAVTTVLGFGAAVVAPVALPAGQVLAWAAGWPCRWLVGVADFFGGLHGATVPWPSGAAGGMLLLLVTAALWLLASHAGLRLLLAVAAVTAAIVLFPVRAVVSTWPPPGWVFVACDVGQGDALVLNAGPGAAVEIDAGPDPVPIDRCLDDLGVTDIPLLVLTHFHLDHVAGLPGAVRARTVGAMLAGPLDAPESGSQIVRSVTKALGLSVRTPSVGTHIQVGRVRLDVLGPAAPFHDTRSDPNNSSLILKATVDGLRIMLPGDAEIEAQQALLRSGADLRADVLKVPHHGSAYSDPRFLAAVHASLAVVSVGAHNDYGHPSPVLLAEMARLGVPLLRTDRDGDIAVVARDGHPAAVVRGIRASTVGARDPVDSGVPATGVGPVTVRAVLSARGARMTPCPRAPSPRTICPARCRRWSCSWGTRNCSSTGPSARSPPLPAARTRRSPRANGWAGRSRVRSCTRRSARRCSATRGSW